MWTRKLWQAALIGVAMALVLAAVAGAAPKDKCPGPHPSCAEDPTDPPTDPTEDPWSCVRRIENGASAWTLAEWWLDGASGPMSPYFDDDPTTREPTAEDPEPDHYRADGVPACFDIHPAHYGITAWAVEWDAHPDTVLRKNGGLKTVFEREVHGDAYYEFTTSSLSACHATDPALFNTGEFSDGVIYDVDNMAVVVMPRTGDKWVFGDGHHLTITPLGACP